MKYYRIYCDPTGESYIGEAEVEQSLVSAAPPAPPLYISPFKPVTKYSFWTVPAGWDGGWHPSPNKQFFVVTSGVVEGEVSDGKVIRCGPGTIILLEDTWGKGHKSRVVGGVELQAFVVQLPT